MIFCIHLCMISCWISTIGSPDQYFQYSFDLNLSLVGCTSRSQTKELMSPRNESMERAELTMEDWIHETCLISSVTSGPTDPKTFQEAWHSPAEEERNNWQAAIRKEIKGMINRGVWRKIDKVKIPENRRLMVTRFEFELLGELFLVFATSRFVS